MEGLAGDIDRDEALAKAVASGLGKPDIGGPKVITTKQTFSAALDETQERGWATAIERQSQAWQP